MIKHILFLLALALVLNACASPRTKIVKVPIKCDIPKREKPKKQSNTIAYLKEILIYTESLERDLAFCRGVAP